MKRDTSQSKHFWKDGATLARRVILTFQILSRTNLNYKKSMNNLNYIKFLIDGIFPAPKRRGKEVDPWQENRVSAQVLVLLKLTEYFS